MRLKGKIAVVVGAGQSPGEGLGNGRATVLRFAQEGAAVLAVDRDLFSAGVQRRVMEHPNVRVVREEATDLPSPGIIATGPLTSDTLSADIAALVGGNHLGEAP